jgi:hypothetical protein
MNEWKTRYKEYIDKRYLELLDMSKEQKISKIELLMLGAVKFKFGELELMTVVLPFHSDTYFIFLKNKDGDYNKW